MGVVKEAFKEGRNTKKEWKNSEAIKNDLAISVLASNMKFNLDKIPMESIAMVRIDPETGKEVDVYPTRYHAAKWVIKNVLKAPKENIHKKALSITGNMHMCCLSGFKSYGFYWKQIKKDEYEKKVKLLSKKYLSPIVWCDGNLYYSIGDASRKTGVSEKVIRRINRKDSPMIRVSRHRFQKYNSIRKNVYFPTKAEALRKFITTGEGNRLRKEQVIVNNYIVKIKGS